MFCTLFFNVFNSFHAKFLLLKKIMAASLPVPSPLVISFDTARQDFLRDFPHGEYRETLSQFTSIDDVYNATDDIQRKQGESQMLRNLAKIQPYLECLDQYATVLDTVVQVKPEILALIWVRILALFVVRITEAIADLRRRPSSYFS